MEYEERPATDIVQEMLLMSRQLQNVEFHFTDSVLRAKGLVEFADILP